MRCPFCDDEVEPAEAALACPACNARYHRSCGPVVQGGGAAKWVIGALVVMLLGLMALGAVGAYTWQQALTQAHAESARLFNDVVRVVEERDHQAAEVAHARGQLERMRQAAQELERQLEEARKADTVAELNAEIERLTRELGNERRWAEKGRTLEKERAVQQATWTVGSTMDDVRRVQGQPTSIQEYGYGGVLWYYGASRVAFRDGRVLDWANDDGNLKARR